MVKHDEMMTGLKKDAVEDAGRIALPGVMAASLIAFGLLAGMTIMTSNV
jgi:hypothetical protein